MEELALKLEKSEDEKRTIIDNPHTVWTVSNVLDLNLTRDQREKAGRLAFKIFKCLNADKEPARHELFGATVNRYSHENLWIVKLSVKRVSEGTACEAPAEDLLSKEDWIRCCAEVCNFRVFVPTILTLTNAGTH
jgi:hypothetical protein